jgi:lipopolysaccharide export system permease protein
LLSAQKNQIPLGEKGMRILTRMIAKEVLISSFFITLALVALFAFFDLIGQASDIGMQYSIFQAFALTALVLPTRCYEVLPIAAILGGVFTLAKLAANSEFTVMRTSGLSPWRLCGMLMLPGLVMVLIAYGMGEYIAPPMQQFAKEFKMDLKGNTFRGKTGSTGIWVRDVERDEKGATTSVNFINVDNFKPGEAAYNWRIYTFRQANLTTITTAKKGVYDKEKGWVLSGVTEQRIPVIPSNFIGQTDEAVKVIKSKTLVWGKGLEEKIFGLLIVKPEDMALTDLYQYIEHLRENGQQTRTYEAAFWNKAFYPLAILVMLILAMPFAYINARSGGIAIKIFLGIMIGIAFYALDNLFAFMTVLSSIPPAAAALTPNLLMLFLASIVMYIVERR